MITVVHLEEHSGDWDAPLTPVTMRCGEVVLITDDGECHPPSIDFVAPPDPMHQVDCARCLALMALEHAGVTEAA